MTPLSKAVDRLSPLLRDSNITVVQDCHTVDLDAEDTARDNGGTKPSASHSTAYSCYTTENQLYNALVDVDIQLAAKDRKLPDKLEHLLDLVREDNAYFKLSLSESER